jgi:hypothetical protein
MNTTNTTRRLYTDAEIIADAAAFKADYFIASTEDITATERTILALIDKATGKKVKGTAPWPGLPVGQLRLAMRTIVQNMITRGEIEEVSRPRVTNPTQLAHFYRRTVGN